MPITIISNRDGFRRCGVAHSKEPTKYKDGHFSDEELEILEAEPMLTVSKTKEKNVDPGFVPAMNAKDTIAAIKKAASIEDVAVLTLKGEDRKSVLEAAAARRTELETAVSAKDTANDDSKSNDSTEQTATEATASTGSETNKTDTSEPEGPAMNAKNTIAAIKAATDVKALDALIPETETRKSVLEAATAKRTELEAAD